MADLSSFQAKVCYTAAGILIHDHRVLLVKHRKLGIWLNPGGHIEGEELPHQAAEREVWEETGITVKAQSSGLQPESGRTEYQPMPLLINLHWISRENYDFRLGKGKRSAETAKKWSRGCEQHLNFIYLVKPVGSVEFKENKEETLGIAWFTPAELKDLETTPDIRHEIELAFKRTAASKK